jgi:hypothetical protein
VAGDGHEGIQAVFTERQKVGGDMAFTLLTSRISMAGACCASRGAIVESA